MFIAGMNYALLEDKNAVNLITHFVNAAIDLYENKEEANPVQKVIVNLELGYDYFKGIHSDIFDKTYYATLASLATKYGNYHTLAMMAAEVFEEKFKNLINEGADLDLATIEDITKKYFEHKNEIENPEIDPEISAEVDRMTQEIEEELDAEHAVDEDNKEEDGEEDASEDS